MTKLVLGLTMFLGVGLESSALQAQDAQSKAVVSLRAELPEDCPDDVELVHRIEALLGRSLADSTAEPLRVHLHVAGDAQRGFAADIAFSSARGEDRRTLEHPTCSKLIEAAALLIALAVDPDAVRAAQHSQHADEAAEPTVKGAAVADGSAASIVASRRPSDPPPGLPRGFNPPTRASRAQHRDTVAIEPEREREPTREHTSSSLRGLRLGLAGALAAGALPGLGGGLQATVGFQRSAFRAEVLGRYWATRSQTVPVAPNASADLDLVTLGVRGCWLPLVSTWSVAACVGADSGDLRGTGNGLEAARTSHARYSDLTAGVRVSYTRWRLAPEGGFEGVAAVERPAFGVRENGVQSETYRPAAWGLVAFLGAAFQL